MQRRDNYLNESEICERLKLNTRLIWRFHRLGYLQLVRTSTGFLVLTVSAEQFESRLPDTLAEGQRQTRKFAERARLKASQRILAL